MLLHAHTYFLKPKLTCSSLSFFRPILYSSGHHLSLFRYSLEVYYTTRVKNISCDDSIVIVWYNYYSSVMIIWQAMSINGNVLLHVPTAHTCTERPTLFLNHLSSLDPSRFSFEDCTSGTLALDNLGYSTDQRWLWGMTRLDWLGSL